MKAAVYRKAHAGKVLEIRDLDQPLPKDNEVLLRVRAASVNPLDWRMKSERPGVDVAGEIVAVGKHVTQFKPGHATFGVGKGAFAEYACARACKLALKTRRRELRASGGRADRGDDRLAGASRRGTPSARAQGAD